MARFCNVAHHVADFCRSGDCYHQHCLSSAIVLGSGYDYGLRSVAQLRIVPVLDDIINLVKLYNYAPVRQEIQIL